MTDKSESISVDAAPLMARLDELWRLTERARLQAQFAISDEMKLVDRLPTPALREILLQYRFFTLAFTADIAILVERCPPSRLRSFLGELLHDELGQGDPEQAHPALFDRFLASLGAIAAMPSEVLLEQRMHHEVRGILADLNRRTRESSLSYAIGLRGMGGECVCGVYFDELYKRIVHHGFVSAHLKEIDWTFWELHAGHHDVEHATRTRAAIADLAVQGSLDLEQLTEGYEHGIASWNRFWRILYQIHVAPAQDARC